MKVLKSTIKSKFMKGKKRKSEKVVTTQTAATHDSTALAPSDTIISDIQNCMNNRQKRRGGEEERRREGEKREERGERWRERTCFHIQSRIYNTIHTCIYTDCRTTQLEGLR